MRRAGRPVTILDLRRDVGDRSRRSICSPLLLVRDGKHHELPGDDAEISEGDELLFSGTNSARRQMFHLLRNANTAEYVVTGRDTSGSAVGRLFGRRDRVAEV